MARFCQYRGFLTASVKQRKGAGTLDWAKPCYVDADHINLDTNDFFTFDVAYTIGRLADSSAIDSLIRSHPELVPHQRAAGPSPRRDPIVPVRSSGTRCFAFFWGAFGGSPLP